MRLSKNVSSRAHLKSKYCCINTSAWYLSGRIYYQTYGDGFEWYRHHRQIVGKRSFRGATVWSAGEMKLIQSKWVQSRLSLRWFATLFWPIARICIRRICITVEFRNRTMYAYKVTRQDGLHGNGTSWSILLRRASSSIMVLDSCNMIRDWFLFCSVAFIDRGPNLSVSHRTRISWAFLWRRGGLIPSTDRRMVNVVRVALVMTRFSIAWSLSPPPKALAVTRENSWK